MGRIVLKGATIITGIEENVIENGVVVIRDDVIEFVGDMTEMTKDSRVIDLRGKTIMAGIIDCHVHLSGATEYDPTKFVLQDNRFQTVVSVSQAQKLLDWGITSVRDISVNGIALKKVFEQGLLDGPTVVPCGPGLSRTAGHGDAHLLPEKIVETMHPWAIICDTKDEIKKGIRRLIREGSECIKIWGSGGGFWERDSDGDQHYSIDDLMLAVKEARMIGLPVAVHAENEATTLAAAKAGVTSIEHGEELSDDCLEIMKEKGIFLVPTLRLIAGWEDTYDPTPSKNSELSENHSRQELIDIAIETMLNTFKRAVGFGIKICLGSDSYCNSVTPFGQLSFEELHYLASHGMSNMEAIKAATINGAELLGISSSVGTIEIGKKADIIVLSENPLESIRNVNYQHLKMVIKNGKIIKNLLQ